jgi:hypothetical protein
MQMLQGQRPDLTPAQLTGLLAAGVPVIANLLHVFGVYDVSPEQQDALNKLIQYGALVAIGLFGSDLGLRAARNHADAKVKAAVLNVPDGPPLGPTGPVVNGATLGLVTAANGGTAPTMGATVGLPSNGSADTDLPTDEEEFGPGGPDDDQGPESRLQPVVPEDDQP